MQFDEAQAQAYLNAEEKGFHIARGVDDKGSMIALALITSEIGEAVEALRDGDMAGFHEELADIIIRTLDLAACTGGDMDSMVHAKIEKNRGRPYLHNGRKF